MTDASVPGEPLDTDSDVAVTWRGMLLVAMGGAVGTLARHVFGDVFPEMAGLPLGSLVINATGALILGVLIGLLARKGADRGRNRELRLLLGTGLLGGFTTYSLLAGELAGFALVGECMLAVGYAVLTIVVGGTASWFGLMVSGVDRSAL